MTQFLRFSISGILGIAIVMGLFFMMSWLLNHDNSISLSTDSDVEFVKYQQSNNQKQQLKPNEDKKKQREKPLLQQALNLQLTDTGNMESGQGDNYIGNSLGTEFGIFLASIGNVPESDWNLYTGHTYKDNLHNLKFPDKARQAGYTEGTLVATAVFSKSNEFLRFEIIEENPVGYFRDVLYQLKFPINYYNYAQNKQTIDNLADNLYNNIAVSFYKDAEDIHSYTFKFIFDLNSSEPVKFYRMGKQ